MRQLFISKSGQLRDRWEKAFPNAEVVSRAADISDVATATACVIWLDINVPASRKKGGDIEQAVASDWPVVVLSPMPAESEAFQLLNAGCVGYCHVNAAPEQLREIALVVERGGLWMPPQLVQRLLALSVRVAPASEQARLSQLTAREKMVAEQVGRGASNREIAQALEISERTVKAHLSAIFEKMAVRDRVHLALAMHNIPTNPM